MLIPRPSSPALCFLATALISLSVCGTTLAADPPAKPAENPSAETARRVEFFEAKIRPVLARHCYGCHSDKAGKDEGGLRLDTRSRIRDGGDRGPAVVPGDVEKSLLLGAMAHADAELKMPPRQPKLSADIVNDFKTWIRDGAVDPREDPKQGERSAKPPVGLESGRKFWAFQRPVVYAPPATTVGNWPKTDVDRFILAKLGEAGLVPSVDAEPTVLLRRLHFDLVGLPPSPAEIKAFQESVAANGLDAALPEFVDSLLSSSQFAERWGRHWLDVARFAESSGKEANISFPYAWRYRDYVIDAIDSNMPYDEFLTEQIAGDLLPVPEPDPQAIPSLPGADEADRLIATGFLAVGPKNLEEGNPKQFAADVVDEQIDAVTRAVMASSVACARCHDHKFDPFSMEDYYALAGVFSSTKTYFGTFVSPANRVGGDPLVLPVGAGLPIFHPSIPAARVQQLKAELASLKKQQEDGMAAVMKAALKGEDTEKVFTLRDALRIFWVSGGIEGQLEKVDENGKALPLAMGVKDCDPKQIADAPLLERGEIGHPGKRVPRGFPRVVQLPETITIPAGHSGRLEFARWLTHPGHPLTSRVIVNRVWKHLFGAGIVRTVDNFGFTGERPTHPELLDTLAVQFVAEDEWSLKKLIRKLVLSRTYRQASSYKAATFQVDPENRLLWRASKRRLDAEAIRDAMLAASGELDLTRPSGSLVARQIGDRPIALIGLDPSLPADLDGTRHRSVYLPVLRDRLPDVLNLFDFAEPSLVTGDRETTNVPTQALYLMNGPFVQARAAALAAWLSKDYSSAGSRVRQAFLLCLSREPDAEELRLATEFLAKTDAAETENQLKAFTTFCQALLATAEFRNLD